MVVKRILESDTYLGAMKTTDFLKRRRAEPNDRGPSIEMRAYLEAAQVLIVDDTRHFAQILRTILRSFGSHRTRVANSAIEGLEIMRTTPVDLVTVDLEMPEIDGYEFISMIRRARDLPDPYVPILVISGDRRAKSVKRARQAGADGFLAKPTSAASLAIAIGTLVMRRFKEDAAAAAEQEGGVSADPEMRATG